MKSVFDKPTRDQLIKRIDLLTESSKAQWGKMSVSQMLRHCVLCEEMYLGKTTTKRAFIGRVFGRLVLKKMLKDEKPLQQNAPTYRAFVIHETGVDLSSEKEKWIALVKQYAHYTNTDFVHWFFGKMTREQVGQFVFKHTDHHLRQFGV